MQLVPILAIAGLIVSPLGMADDARNIAGIRVAWDNPNALPRPGHFPPPEAANEE